LIVSGSAAQIRYAVKKKEKKCYRIAPAWDRPRVVHGASTDRGSLGIEENIERWRWFSVQAGLL
jgi:hypothetical protein